MGSNAVSQNLIAQVVGYNLTKLYNNLSSPNLPQNIVVLGEANDANQSGLTADTLVQITSAAQAASLYGSGSPLHLVSRILFPQGGQGVSVPVFIAPQAKASGAVAKVITVTPTGTATAAGTIFLNISGRELVDGKSYAVAVAVGDTPTAISTKMQAAVANVLASPVIASGTTTCVLTAKWSGLTSNDITVSVDTQGQSLGVTFSVASTTAGSGTPTTANALNNFANGWYTTVINTYGLVSQTVGELEAANGIPDPTNPTGKYAGLIMRPFIAFTGSTLDDPTSITGATARQTQVTIAVCPAPLSQGLPFEAAANMAVLWANVAQNTPQSDVQNLNYPDMPGPVAGVIPQMNGYTFREKCVENGCSTADWTGGAYKVKDFVTTYAASGEYPAFYRYCRDLNVHFNIKFGYFLLVHQFQINKTVAKDSDTVTADNVIKPKDWKAIVKNYCADLGTRGLIANVPYSQSNIVVTINSTNPNRLDTTFPYTITGIVRISSTTVAGGFNFSN